MKKRVAAVYLLTPGGKTIAGYYTLSQYAIDAGDLPSETAPSRTSRSTKNYQPQLLERLARRKEFKGLGMGEMLLVGALKRALEHSRPIASLLVVVEAK